MVKKLILASGSARRREILSTIGLEHTVLVSDVDETIEKLSPRETVETLAARKCAAVVDTLSEAQKKESIVISADTVVSVGDEIFGKPRDREDAKRMLRALSDSHHHVLTGIAVWGDGRMTVESEATEVCFRPVSDEEIDLYISIGEPMDKAGAYGIQETGGVFVESVNGDYFNIVGLPVCRLTQILSRDFGYDPLRAIAQGKK